MYKPIVCLVNNSTGVFIWYTNNFIQHLRVLDDRFNSRYFRNTREHLQIPPQDHYLSFSSMWNMWLHFLSWKRKLFQSKLQLSIWYGANSKEEYVNFYRNSVETSLFSLFLQGKIFKKIIWLKGFHKQSFSKKLHRPSRHFPFMTSPAKQCTLTNYWMANHKTVRDEQGNNINQESQLSG